MLNKIKAIIFDLDDTLYDCTGTLVLKNKKSAAKIISKSINCSEAEAFKLQVEIENCLGPQADIFREITKRYKLSDKFYNEISEPMDSMDIESTMLFPDTMDSIKELKRRRYKLFLVTYGKRNVQKKKIKVLGLEKVFNEIKITENPAGKEKCFMEILIQYRLEPEQVLCVGDKIKDEIEVGRKLGMNTILMKHGRHYNFYKSKIKSNVTYTKISKISDLLKYVEN